MPRIEHIVGEGPELAESQRRVLELLEAHPDYLFRMAESDLVEIRNWLPTPEAAAPPAHVGGALGEQRSYSVGTIKWALSTLHGRGKIGSTKLHRRSYYGSHRAIDLADERENHSAREKMKELRDLSKKAHGPAGGSKRGRKPKQKRSVQF